MSSPAAPANMAVTFLDVERNQLEKSSSNVDLSKFNSAAPTLNNTPNESRNSSPVRGRGHEKLANRTPTPSPKPEDIEAMDKEQSSTRRVTSYSNDELEISWMGTVIVACFFTSGMIDAVAFNSWNCFVGMQTGNTIFAALGLGGLPYTAHSLQYVKSFVAIGSFCLGTLFFNTLHRSPTGFHNQPTSRRRIVFALSFATQSLLILTAATLVTSEVVSTQPFVIGQFSSGTSSFEADKEHRNYRDFIPIFLLAFEAAGQVCLSRVLTVIELPTIVLSTLYHDWTADLLCTRNLWNESTSVKDFIFVSGRRQHKRLACIIALFMGGIVGGEMYKSPAGMAGALWFAVAIKGCMAIAFALWPKQKEDSDS